MVMSDLIGLIPLAPLLGFLFIGFVNKDLTKGWVSFLACASVFFSFVLSIALFIGLLNLPEGEEQIAFTYTAFEWISAGNFNVSFSFLVDPLSSIMMLIITGVGFLIHVYSTGYMHDDD